MKDFKSFKVLAVILTLVVTASSILPVGAVDLPKSIFLGEQPKQLFTEPITEAQTEIQTEPITEAQTEIQTESITEAQTEIQTQPPTEIPTKEMAVVPKLKTNTITVGVGESCYFSEFLDESQKNESFIFLSSNRSIVSLDVNKRMFTAKAVGTIYLSVGNKNNVYTKLTVIVKNAPTKIDVKNSQAIMGIGETAQISTVFQDDEYAHKITYISSNSSIASVDKNTGVVTANKTGTTTIVADAYNGVKFTYKVTVKNAPTQIKLHTAVPTLEPNETYTPLITFNCDEGASKINYVSTNSSIVSVDKNTGKLTAKKEGTVTILASLYNGIKLTYKVTVKILPENLSLSLTSMSMAVGETANLGIIIDKDSPISCTSSTPNILSVVKNGNDISLKAIKTGVSTIQVTTPKGAEALCIVTVKSPATSVSLNKSSITLGVGETFQLEPTFPDGTTSYNMNYVSNKTSVASVKLDNGLITANSVGTAIITARTSNGKIATCTVNVQKAPESIAVDVNEIHLAIGDTYDINSMLKSGYASYHIGYTSNKPEIASVKSGGGIVTAKSVGTAVITAKTFNDKKVSVNVYVYAKGTVNPGIVKCKLTTVAKAEVGNRGSKYRQWFYGIDFYGIDWCAIYVSWLYNQVDGIGRYVVKTDGAGCFARECDGIRGTWYKPWQTLPRQGDIITFRWGGYYSDTYHSDHVGYVYYADSQYVYTIEGNTGSDFADYSEVKMKKYALDYICINGYYRPYYY